MFTDMGRVTHLKMQNRVYRQLSIDDGSREINYHISFHSPFFKPTKPYLKKKELVLADDILSLCLNVHYTFLGEPKR